MHNIEGQLEAMSVLQFDYIGPCQKSIIRCVLLKSPVEPPTSVTKSSVSVESTDNGDEYLELYLSA